MRGDVKEVKASSVNTAIAMCKALYPETTSWDILKVINEKGKEV